MYDGIYAGTYVGDDSSYDQGYWVAVITADPSTSFFLTWSMFAYNDGGHLSYMGETAGKTGHFYSLSVMNVSTIDAYIDSYNGFTVTGTWVNDSESGEFSGGQVDACTYSGALEGTFGGDDEGEWSMTIGTDCHIDGTMFPDVGGSYSFTGACHPDGYMAAMGSDASGTFIVAGQFSSATYVSGSWAAETGESGAFATRTSGGGLDEEGGGGGCFILGLIDG
ncbi:MAG: hypothetical protein C4519_11615 [Desulfobacteraceae bacterium]|nr:MAG: hypothetical protein C4519_11615 [Desulfobacteraceae bacterium]